VIQIIVGLYASRTFLDMNFDTPILEAVWFLYISSCPPGVIDIVSLTTGYHLHYKLQGTIIVRRSTKLRPTGSILPVFDKEGVGRGMRKRAPDG